MIVARSMSLLSKVCSLNEGRIFEDVADRLSSTVSVLILMLFASVVAMKSYFLSPLSCYIPTFPTSGLNFQSFVETYCWTHGTYYLARPGRLPTNKDEWNTLKDRIDYYQWIPFILAFQTACFYLPRVVWHYFTAGAVGRGVETQFESLNSKLLVSDDEVDALARVVHHTVRPVRRDRQSKRANRDLRLPQCGLICVYFIVKLLYLSNGLFQMLYIHRLLGVGDSLSDFVEFIKTYRENFNDWSGGKYFPRVSLCHIHSINAVGATQRFMAQCVLAVNMVNEKIYLFLWLWSLFIVVITFISAVYWGSLLLREAYRPSLMNYLLTRRDIQAGHGDAAGFSREYLRGDRLFVLIMLKSNLNRELFLRILETLWTNYGGGPHLEKDISEENLPNKYSADDVCFL